MEALTSVSLAIESFDAKLVPPSSLLIWFSLPFSDNSISIYFSEYIVNSNAGIKVFFVRHSFFFLRTSKTIKEKLSFFHDTGFNEGNLKGEK